MHACHYEDVLLLQGFVEIDFNISDGVWDRNWLH
jgi:hypothetical protein